LDYTEADYADELLHIEEVLKDYVGGNIALILLKERRF